MSHKHLNPIIIDPGANTLKMGLVGDMPATIISSIVGVPKGAAKVDSNSMVFGDEAVSKRDSLDLHHIYENGKVTNWEYLEAFLTHAVFHGLRTDPQGQVYVVAEPAGNSRGNEDRMAAIFFHQFSAAAVAFVPAPTLALAAAGKTTGLVVTCGAQVTEVVAIKDGAIIPSSIATSKIAGDTVTRELMATTRGGTGGQIDEIIANDIKDNLCYVALDFSSERTKLGEITKEYTLLSGEPIKVGLERFVPPELYFNPGLRFQGPEYVALPDLIQKSLESVDGNLQQELCSNIILNGGSSLLTGLPERLEKELSTGVLNYQPKVNAPMNRSYSVWVGGANLVSKSAFREHFVTQQEFKEKGFKVIQDKVAIPIKL